MKYVSDVPSLYGTVRVVADDTAVMAVAFHPERSAKLGRLELTGREKANRISTEAARQLGEYFAGTRTRFDIPVCLDGLTPFSREVLNELEQVPYGAVLTYGELAKKCGRPQAARAVGRIMAANPIPIIIPCHRVIGRNGRMTGYSGGDGISTKEGLLALEGRRPVSS